MVFRISVLPILYFSVFLSILQTASSVSPLQEKNPPKSALLLWADRQTQISALFNFHCLRNSAQVAANTSGFDPLTHLSLYTNPEVVTSFTKALQAGTTSPKWGPYLSGAERSDTIPMFDILYFIDTSTPEGWTLFYNTTAYFFLRANVRQFIMAMELISSTKFFGRIVLPRYSATVPQFFTPRDVLRGINDILVQTPDQIVESGEGMEYWKNDAGYREFHFSWNMDLPPDLNQTKYNLTMDRKGELFLYSHHYMEVRYFAERMSEGLPDIVPLSLDPKFRVTHGYSPSFLMADLSPWPVRGPGAALTTQSGFKNLTLWEDRIFKSFKDGFAVGKSGEHYPYHASPETEESDIAGTEVFGALYQSSTASVDLDFYGNLHESLHLNLAELRDPRYPKSLPPNVMGVMDHAESSVTDSAFYQVHYYVDNLYKKHKYQSPTPRTTENLAYPEFQIRDLKLDSGPNATSNEHGFPVLTTFFDYYTYDVSNAVIDCNKLGSGAKFAIARKRLNYNQFEYKLHLTSSLAKEEDTIIRIFMAPSLSTNGKPQPLNDLYWNMIEMDKFPVVIKPGDNLISRSSGDSSILKKNSVLPGTPVRTCGWPSNLLLPKGTVKGLDMKLFVIVSPALERHGVKLTTRNEHEYPAFSLCGHPYSILPDDKPMGYPFDKKLILKDPFVPGQNKNWGFYDVTIKHLGG